MALFKQPTREEEVRNMPAQDTRPMQPQQQAGIPNLKREGQLTVIAKDTVIKGDITSDSAIELEGQVKGNITCKAEVTISGSIKGDIAANSLIAEHATIDGNISGAGTVNLTQSSKIKGNVSAEKVVLAATIQGDITARELVVLEREAVVIGNVNTKFIEIEMGASVEGTINAKSREVKNMQDVSQLEVKDTARPAAPGAAAAPAAEKKEPATVK